jgi:hypothetical protein
MTRKRLGKMLLIIAACVSTVARPPVNHAAIAAPDLRIKEFVFPAENEKAVRVHLVNDGGAGSPLCILRLTVRKINGVPAGRVTEVKVPPLAPGKDKWLVINASSILPNNVSLASTTFKLNADATSIITESDEANNEVWHNL